jgi:short-subunit dehydrogenase
MGRTPESIYGKDASILITGASSGIGAALAELLAGYGGKLALVARRVERLEEVADRVRARGAEPRVVPCDVTDRGAVREAHERILVDQGPVEVAFLNAGIGDHSKLTGFDAQRLVRMFEVNVFGVLYWMEAILPDMISRGRGTLVPTSSLAAARGMPGAAGYAATKAAVSSLFEGYRAEARRHGLQVTVVEPGFVRTEIKRKAKKLPFLVDAEPTAQIIAEGVAEGRSLIRFPWQTAAAMQLLRHLPDSLFDRVMAGRRRS